MSRREEIIDVARELLERGTPDGVTMQGIADELGIRSPSLYKHVGNKHEVEVALLVRGLTEQAAEFADAVASSADSVAAIARAYRKWALANPRLYALMNASPLPRNDLPDSVEAAAAAPLIEAVQGDADRARALWAFAHGMVSLELADRFPTDADLDAAWSTGLAGLMGGADSQARTSDANT